MQVGKEGGTGEVGVAAYAASAVFARPTAVPLYRRTAGASETKGRAEVPTDGVTGAAVRPSVRLSARPPEWERGGDRKPTSTKFIELNVKSLANSPNSTGMAFWSINPYVGCELGCSYCYAHYVHRYTAERTSDYRSTEAAFTQHIFVKQRKAAIHALEHDLARIHRHHSPDNPATLAIGTATDPYQPAERQFGITRVILERFLTAEGVNIGITTKSPLVCRDIDVLLELGRNHRVTVYISLICKSTRLIRLFEQRTPLPQARLRALSRLREAGINAGINAAPVLPGVTDSVFDVEALIAAAKQAGASFVHPSVLRMYPSVRDEFLPVIEQHFPNLIPRYRAAYQQGQSAPTNYQTAIQRRFEKLARKYGISPADPFKREERPRVEPEVQLSLL
jgi:DNA repair photolyase